MKGIAGDEVWKSGSGGGSALGFNDENPRSETPSYNDSYNSYNNNSQQEEQFEIFLYLTLK